MTTSDNSDHIRMSLLLKNSELMLRIRGLLITAEEEKYKGNLDECSKKYFELEEIHLQILDNIKEMNRLPGPHFDPISTASTLLNVLFMHADILQTLKQKKDADLMREKAFEISKEYLGAAGMAEAERSRAASLLLDGRFNDAFMALTTALNYFKAENNLGKVCRTTIDLADLLQWLGDYQRAMDYITRAESDLINFVPRKGLEGIQDNIEISRMKTEIVYYRGLISRYTGNYEEAEKALNQVLPLYEQLGCGPAIKFQLAAIALAAGRTQEALEQALVLEPHTRESGLLRPKRAAFLKILAEGYFKLGRHDKALSTIQDALEDILPYHDLDLQWKLEYLQAKILAAMGKKEEALTGYANAVNSVMDLRRAPLGYRFDTTYLRDKMQLFEDAILYAVTNNSYLAALHFMDAIKSRTLKVIFGTRINTQIPIADHDNEFEELNRQLDANEYAGFISSDKKGLKAERNNLLARRADLIEKMRIEDIRWRNLSEPEAVDIQSLQEELQKKNQSVLSLFLMGDKCVSVLITPSELYSGIMEMERISAALELYTDNIRRTNTADPRLYDPSSISALRIENIIPEPILDRMISYHSVIIVPHGLLHLLPWSVMVYKGKRLFQYCAVGVLPNLSACLALRYQPSLSPKLIMLGPPEYPSGSDLSPLPLAVQEADCLSRIYSERCIEKKSGKDLTEKMFWDVINRPTMNEGIIHFAGHAGIEQLEPMNSGLYLSDGKADAAEILHARMPCPEFILSACHTGWRPTAVGDLQIAADEILSIPGAFLESGARSVLVSIPPAQDKASMDFMTQYHTQRANGISPIESFRYAQMQLFQEGQQPALWAGFTLYGCE